MARKTRVSTRERLAIVEEAIRLIRKPGTWTKGKWRCEVGETRRGDLVYAYCIDGAVGYAALSVLGPKRAAALGIKVYENGGEDGEIEDGGTVADLLSVRRLAFDALTERGVYFTDDEYDDSTFNSYQVEFNDHDETTREDVLALLRRKARELRAKVKALDARKGPAF